MSRQHVVRQGECLSLIARRYGFSNYRKIYDHPDNAELRRRRPNPNILFPGDVIVIPDPENRVAQCQTGKSHRFVLSRPRRFLRLVLQNSKGEPMAGQECTVRVGGVEHPLVAASDGLIELEIGNETEAFLTVDEVTRRVRIGDLNPTRDTDDEGVSGVQARLHNLGYCLSAIDGILGPETARAIRAFQRDHGLEVTGVIDDALLHKLHIRHEC